MCGADNNDDGGHQRYKLTHTRTDHQDYDDNDPDLDTETYPVAGIEQHPLIECGEETERTTLLGQGMAGARPGNSDSFLCGVVLVCVALTYSFSVN